MPNTPLTSRHANIRDRSSSRLCASHVMFVLALMMLWPASADAGRYGSRRGSDVAGKFDYYALVMSWSPTHCATLRKNIYDPQCHRRDGRRYAFVLHGLWPQYERGYPEYCRTRGRPFVPNRVIDSMLDVMPSKKLIIHEYKKHGTCSGLDPDGYYKISRHLFEQIRVPERYINPFDAQFVSPRELEQDFLRENPQLKPSMISISCRGSGNRLREIMVCFSRDGKLRACGQNENQRRLCRADRMFVPPVRSSKAPARRSTTSKRASPAKPAGQSAGPAKKSFEKSPLPGPGDYRDSPLPGPR